MIHLSLDIRKLLFHITRTKKEKMKYAVFYWNRQLLEGGRRRSCWIVGHFFTLTIEELWRWSSLGIFNLLYPGQESFIEEMIIDTFDTERNKSQLHFILSLKLSSSSLFFCFVIFSFIINCLFFCFLYPSKGKTTISLSFQKFNLFFILFQVFFNVLSSLLIPLLLSFNHHFQKM